MFAHEGRCKNKRFNDVCFVSWVLITHRALETSLLGLTPQAFCLLCDLGQVTQPLSVPASVCGTVKWAQLRSPRVGLRVRVENVDDLSRLGWDSLGPFTSRSYC